MRATVLSLSFLFLAILPGCAARTPVATPAPQSMAPIHDFSEIAGKWEGVMTRSPHHPEDDWVSVAISPDGAFKFASYRETGLLHGDGTLKLANGQAVRDFDDGSVTFTLYNTDGHKVLRAVGSRRGLRYESNLTPAR